ncbi:MAG: glycosyltransferase [Desulfomonilia bacterium]|nr:glycosyltransferase [Desulfomonilia bacterium]
MIHQAGEHSGKLAAAERYREQRAQHWDLIAKKRDTWQTSGSYYHQRLEQIYTHLVSPGQKILELGCGTGELLATLTPSVGVGLDFSSEMISRAREKFPDLRFIQADAHEFELDETFDVIILSDLVNDLWDVQAVIENLQKVSTPETRIIINVYSHLWELPMLLAQRAGKATPLLPQNWLTVEDLANMLNLAGFEVFRHWQEVLWPLGTLGLSTLCNRYLVKIWPLSWFALTNFLIARRRPDRDDHEEKPTVSIVVPARNEAGHIEDIFARTTELGSRTELIFVEGNSTDNTYETIEQAIARHPERSARLFKQQGRGKGDAVRLGFEQATGDILMILDADMTVPPEDLPRFYDAIASGQGEFINGVRLVYPMEEQAMRYLNLLGNKFFSLAFSWLLGQPIKDTLCGTKVLSRENYEKVARNRSYFGDFDPFGDFDLLFGAAKQNLKIVEMPIRYAERKYGETNIDRWRHGWMLLKMTLYAMRKIKFV